MRELVRQFAPEAPVYREFTMEFLARRSMIQLSFTMLTLGVVSGLALLLGAIGLYGVLSYVVSQRTREIGVRMALGATASAVRRMVVSQGARVVLVGVVIGVGVAFAATTLLGALLYGVKPVDPIVFAAMSAMMIGMGSWRATCRRGARAAWIRSSRCGATDGEQRAKRKEQRAKGKEQRAERHGDLLSLCVRADQRPGHRIPVQDPSLALGMMLPFCSLLFARRRSSLLVVRREQRRRIRTDQLDRISAGPEIRRSVTVLHLVADRLESPLEIRRDIPEFLIAEVAPGRPRR